MDEELVNELRTMGDNDLYKMFMTTRSSYPHMITYDDVVDVQSGVINIKYEINKLKGIKNHYKERNKKVPLEIEDSIKKFKNNNYSELMFDIRDCPQFENSEERIQIVYHQSRVIYRFGNKAYDSTLYAFREEYERRISKMREQLIDIYSEDNSQFGSIFTLKD